MKLIYCLPALLCLWLMVPDVQAQATKSSTQATPTDLLKSQIGMTVPNVPLQLADGSTQNLRDYAGKPLLLCFVSIYCGSCVKEIPRLHQLEARLTDSAQILLVARESPGEVAEFFGREKNRNIRLPVMVKDTVLTQLFAHQLVPHFVWIDPQQRVAAITESRDVTEANVRKMIEGRPPVLPQKKDLPPFDEHLPVLTGGLPPAGVPCRYNSTLSPYIAGAEAMEGLYSDSLHLRMVCVNHTIPGLYQALGGLASNRILIDPANRLRMVSPNTLAWEKENQYSYELTAPKLTSIEDMHRLMKEDIDRYFGLLTGFAARRVSCWRLVARRGFGAIPSRDSAAYVHVSTEDSDWIVKGATAEELVRAMNNVPRVGGAIFTNGVESNVRMDMRLTVADIEDIESVRRELKRYGLDLVKEERVLEMFEIKSANTTKPKYNQLNNQQL